MIGSCVSPGVGLLSYLLTSELQKGRDNQLKPHWRQNVRGDTRDAMTDHGREKATFGENLRTIRLTDRNWLLTIPVWKVLESIFPCSFIHEKIPSDCRSLE